MELIENCTTADRERGERERQTEREVSTGN
jgi:hypothetical protein